MGVSAYGSALSASLYRVGSAAVRCALRDPSWLPSTRSLLSSTSASHPFRTLWDFSLRWNAQLNWPSTHRVTVQIHCIIITSTSQTIRFGERHIRSNRIHSHIVRQKITLVPLLGLQLLLDHQCTGLRLGSRDGCPDERPGPC